MGGVTIPVCGVANSVGEQKTVSKNVQTSRGLRRQVLSQTDTTHVHNCIRRCISHEACHSLYSGYTEDQSISPQGVQLCARYVLTHLECKQRRCIRCSLSNRGSAASLSGVSVTECETQTTGASRCDHMFWPVLASFVSVVHGQNVAVPESVVLAD